MQRAPVRNWPTPKATPTTITTAAIWRTWCGVRWGPPVPPAQPQTPAHPQRDRQTPLLLPPLRRPPLLLQGPPQVAHGGAERCHAAKEPQQGAAAAEAA